MSNLNLLAYIPTLNQRHLDWFANHPGSDVWLVSQKMAEGLLPRLVRNMAAVPTEVQLESISNLPHPWKLKRDIAVFAPEDEDPDLESPTWKDWILADEDVSHALAEKYFAGREDVSFEKIWARYDMQAVKAQQPILPDCEVSVRDLDIFRIAEAEKFSERSPDWWRQIGAMVYRGDELLACGWNEHFPSEYETYVFGDPRLNFEARDPEGMDAYVSLHAEEHIMAFCASKGIRLDGASMYINTFPCGRCARAVAMSGIKELFFREGSVFALKALDILKIKDIRIVHVKDPVFA